MSSKKHESLIAQVEQMNEQELRSALVEHLSNKKLGLVWESSDQAINSDVILPELVEEMSCFNGESAPKNLIIEGDNFDSLRLLRNTHMGLIRVIYIDPPYNTGNKDWVYNDKYVGKNDKYRHSQWLEFMYQRMALARDLLTPDGVILISINDENRSRLDLMMEEVMPGRKIGSLVWKTRSGANDKTGDNLSLDHEHILIYANPGFGFNGYTKDFSQYKNPDNDVRGPWKRGDLTKGKSFLECKNGYYPILNPENNVWYPCNPSRGWAFSSEANTADTDSLRAKTMEQYIREGKVLFPAASDEKVVVWNSKEELFKAIESGDVPVTPRNKIPLITANLPDLEFWIGKPIGFGRPSFKRHLADLKSEVRSVSSWIKGVGDEENHDEFTVSMVSQMSGTGEHSVNEILGFKAFNFPKPMSLIKNLIQQCAKNTDIVLDFFGGSGTTAHAVLQANAEDGGNRSFIICTSTEATVSTPDRNICRDVCAERIRRVIHGYSKKPGLGGNFAYIKAVKTEDPTFLPGQPRL